MYVICSNGKVAAVQSLNALITIKVKYYLIYLVQTKTPTTLKKLNLELEVRIRNKVSISYLLELRVLNLNTSELSSCVK
jgi:hypothetical protein